MGGADKEVFHEGEGGSVFFSRRELSRHRGRNSARLRHSGSRFMVYKGTRVLIRN